IDRKRSRAQIFLNRGDSNLAGPTTGNEHIERIDFTEWCEYAAGKLIAQILINRHRLNLSCDMYPARVGVLLILLANLLRDFVFDFGEVQDGIAQLPLLRGLA